MPHKPQALGKCELLFIFCLITELCTVRAGGVLEITGPVSSFYSDERTLTI